MQHGRTALVGAETFKNVYWLAKVPCRCFGTELAGAAIGCIKIGSKPPTSPLTVAQSTFQSSLHHTQMGDAVSKALHQLNATVCNLLDEESDTPGIATPRKTL
jgi:hypothetical protein